MVARVGHGDVDLIHAVVAACRRGAALRDAAQNPRISLDVAAIVHGNNCVAVQHVLVHNTIQHVWPERNNALVVVLGRIVVRKARSAHLALDVCLRGIQRCGHARCSWAEPAVSAGSNAGREVSRIPGAESHVAG